MNALSDIIAKIADTQAALRKIESVMLEAPNRISLRSSYDSLIARHQVLETKFFALTSAGQIDVCSYRFFSDGVANYPIYSFGSALRDFQRWFSTIYDALKTGPKQRSRLSADILAETSLNFAFTYPGSVGIAMTITSELLLFESDLQRAMRKTAEMLTAESSDQIQYFATELGAASVRTLYDWINAHANADLGADIRWVSNGKTIASAFIDADSLRNLKLAIEETSDTEETIFEARGWLVGADTQRHTFHMVFDEAEEIRGRMSEIIGDSYTVELPQYYVATIKKTAFRNYATDEERVSYFIDALRRA